MKKILISSLLTVCLFIIPLTAFAEDILKDIPEVKDFSLHSGVMFRDTPSDVEKKEETQGFSAQYSEWDGAKRVFVCGTFANIDDSQLRYNFSDTDELYTSCYMFATDAEPELTFDEINDKLLFLC